jgi:hypothetical protein
VDGVEDDVDVLRWPGAAGAEPFPGYAGRRVRRQASGSADFENPALGAAGAARDGYPVLVCVRADRDRAARVCDLTP